MLRLCLVVALITAAMGILPAAAQEDPADPAPPPDAIAEMPLPPDEVPEEFDLPPEPEYDFENLEFASGEAVGYSEQQMVLRVRVYLDEQGNAADKVVEVKISPETEITDGEKDLKAGSIGKNADIDVEYRKDDKTATYIFVYED